MFCNIFNGWQKSGSNRFCQWAESVWICIFSSLYGLSVSCLVVLHKHEHMENLHKLTIRTGDFAHCLICVRIYECCCGVLVTELYSTPFSLFLLPDIAWADCVSTHYYIWTSNFYHVLARPDVDQNSGSISGFQSRCSKSIQSKYAGSNVMAVSGLLHLGEVSPHKGPNVGMCPCCSSQDLFVNYYVDKI